MVVRLLNIKNDKSKRLWLVILSALTVATILIGITMYKMFGQNSNINGLIKKDVIFNTISYKCEYNVSIVSNKTLNKYNFEEIYEVEDNGKERFEFITQNELGDEIKYIVENDSLKISSNSQISEYILSDYVVKKTNILSISTFVSIYNDIKEYVKEDNEQKCVKLEIDEVENKTCYRIIFNEYDDDILKGYEDILDDNMNVKKMELLISNDTGKPLQYIVYNEQDKAFIDIDYVFFDINASI